MLEIWLSKEIHMQRNRKDLHIWRIEGWRGEVIQIHLDYPPSFSSLTFPHYLRFMNEIVKIFLMIGVWEILGCNFLYKKKEYKCRSPGRPSYSKLLIPKLFSHFSQLYATSTFNLLSSWREKFEAAAPARRIQGGEWGCRWNFAQTPTKLTIK